MCSSAVASHLLREVVVLSLVDSYNYSIGLIVEREKQTKRTNTKQTKHSDQHEDAPFAHIHCTSKRAIHTLGNLSSLCESRRGNFRFRGVEASPFRFARWW